MAVSPTFRSIDPLASRRPTATATIATEIVANNSREADERNAVRNVRTVARR